MEVTAIPRILKGRRLPTTRKLNMASLAKERRLRPEPEIRSLDQNQCEETGVNPCIMENIQCNKVNAIPEPGDDMAHVEFKVKLENESGDDDDEISAINNEEQMVDIPIKSEIMVGTGFIMDLQAVPSYSDSDNSTPSELPLLHYTLACPKCSTSFAELQKLEHHVSIFHTDEILYFCNYCPAGFCLPSGLISHFQECDAKQIKITSTDFTTCETYGGAFRLERQPSKRRSFPISLKLEAIKYAEANSRNAAARKFDVDPKMIRDWIKLKPLFEKHIKRPVSATGIEPPLCKSSKQLRLDGGGRKPFFKELDVSLLSWISSQREKNLQVSRRLIREKAKEILPTLDDSLKHPNFKASVGWLRRFMKRNEENEILTDLPEDEDEARPGSSWNEFDDSGLPE